ncbi:MAG: hypothetical protein EZS28_044770 [Streblomastix strix]|uniref:Uncharacterized protein n=1 Tax=Streblomastix strix TaxID=222440 RepID=A0A5J4TPC9_9EUKA|nr:MAG: hypothetical protein EZS28_044770 [Streblomastix strix]
MDDDKREISRLKSAQPIPDPSKTWKEHQDEDIVEALSYSATTGKAILEIVDDIAKQYKRIFKKHKKKFICAYRLSEEAERRSYVVREKGAILDRTKGALDSISPPGSFRKNTWNQIVDIEQINELRLTMQHIFQNRNEERKQYAGIFFANGEQPSFSGATAGNQGTVHYTPEEEFATGDSYLSWKNDARGKHADRGQAANQLQQK